MHTSMYHHGAIQVTNGHIAQLRIDGPDQALTWHENTREVEVVTVSEAANPRRMIIATSAGLDEVAEVYDGEPTDDDLARDLADIAGDWLHTWPEVRAMNLQVHDLRSFLADAGVYLHGAPVCGPPGEGLPWMRDHYRLGGAARFVQITVTFGFIEPTRIRIAGRGDGTQPRGELSLEAGGVFSHTSTSRLIASTVADALRTHG
ncbi:hypothetical protein [Nocardiopsis sp. CNT312]|uniref:hypothetical protein n=1 Tax=Nocardiopsis sp. CNT312 TaxID=1137268 RepID=UPI00048F000F|nr:hypothetical protein [Nocardiopsis sp. CNT312]